jgi:type IV pilus assembly protein PilN
MLNINLASRIYIDNRKVSIVLWSAGGLSLLFLALNLWLAALSYQEFSQLKSSLVGGVTAMDNGARQVSEKDFQQMQEKLRFVNGILQRQNQNWLLMLDRLEQVVPDGVMLSSIEPDKQHDSLKIAGYALDFRKVRTLYEAMAAGTLFTDVALVSQSKVKVSEQQQGVIFSLTAKVRH